MERDINQHPEESLVLNQPYYIEEPYQSVDGMLLGEIQKFYDVQLKNYPKEFKRRFGFVPSNVNTSFLQGIYQPTFELEYVAVARSESDRQTIIGVAELREQKLAKNTFPLYPFKNVYEINWLTNPQNDHLPQELIMKLAIFGQHRGITELYFSCDTSDTTTESLVHRITKSLNGEVHPHTDHSNQEREYLLLLPPVLSQKFSSTFTQT